METVDNLQTDTQQTYSLSEVAKYLNVSEGTVRNWERGFSEFLSNYRNRYNHRTFTVEDVQVMERVKGLMESRLFTQSGIKHMLSNKGFSATSSTSVATVQQEGTATPIQQVISPMDEEYKERLLMALNSLGSEIHSLRREMREDLKGTLKREIDHLTLLLFPPSQPKKKSWWNMF